MFDGVVRKLEGQKRAWREVVAVVICLFSRVPSEMETEGCVTAPGIVFES